MHILSEKQEILLVEERQVLYDLRVALTEFGASAEDNDTLDNSISQLDELFLLVVVGEFNAGKSAFINALLGQLLLQEGVTPTTAQINILRFGETQERVVQSENQHILTLPIDWLKEISIVDTPGTNAIIRSHEELTSQFVPRSDLVLFITSADRPFTESERSFLESIHNWGKKVVIAINKIDILQNEDEINQIKSYVEDNARALLGITPEIFPVSARLALRSKQGEPGLLPSSNFAPLEKYIQETLDETSRIKLKFMNPLGVGLFLVDKYLEIIRSRLSLLEQDIQMLTDVESQMGVYSEDMGRDFNFRMSDVENILYEMENRGLEYFDDTFRLARVFDLLNKDRISQEFENEVIGDVPQQIEQKVTELIDWLVDSDLKQWQAVNGHLADRRREYQDRIVGDSGPGNFSYDRQRLIEALGKKAQNVIESYDKSEEASAIAEDAQTAVAASAALEIGAVGLGALVAVLATTMAADVTGVLLASLIAALGLFVIPARRKIAKAEMRDKVTTLRNKLSTTLGAQIGGEIENSKQRINEAISPYTRFVRAERGNLMNSQTKLDIISTTLVKIKTDVDEF